jgi:hypothetical protein
MIVLVAMSTNCLAQNAKPKPKPADKWANWQWLIGDWKGEGEGKPGQGSGGFSFKPDLDNMILVRKSHMEFEKLRDKPMVHDDLMTIYPGYSGTLPKAVYFDNEGHYISYTFTTNDKEIVFTSEHTPNMPIFRLSYYKIDSNEVNTKFEMSKDGTTFQTYMEGKSKRVKPKQ